MIELCITMPFHFIKQKKTAKQLLICVKLDRFKKEGILRFFELFFSVVVVHILSVWLWGDHLSSLFPISQEQRIDCIVFISLCEVNCFIYSRWDSQLIFIIANPLLLVVCFIFFPASLAVSPIHLFIHSFNKCECETVKLFMCWKC